MSDLMLKTWVDLQTRLQTLGSDEEGQGMVEYALILALISIAALAVLTPIGGRLKVIFNQVLVGLGGTAIP